MKKNLLFTIIGFMLGLSVAVGATILYNAKDIEFNPSDASWNVDNMQDAINDIKDNYVPKSEILGKVWEFDYTGGEQTFSVPITGTYKIELWGAQGGSGYKTGGKGAYVTGTVDLNGKYDNLYFYIGGQGNKGTSTSTANGGGYNGGGDNYFSNSSYTFGGSCGGGATDVRIVNGNWNDINSLKSRIMVAAGGGGSGFGEGTSTDGGHGGMLIGLSGGRDTRLNSGELATGGTQTSGGTKSGCGSGWCRSAEDGIFGKGGNAADPRSDSGNSLGYLGGSGGGGYYGGGGGGSGYSFSGAGGSSYIKGFTGCDTTYLSYQGIFDITNAKMIAGNAIMPTYDGTSTMTGNSGNGYAKITLVSLD